MTDSANHIARPLQGSLLAAVSRSFYLSLRFLPTPVRGALSVSYLLARAADTIADVEASPAEQRLVLLGQFRERLSGGGQSSAGGDFFGQVREFASAVDHAGERELLERLGECFASVDRLSIPAQGQVRAVLGHILDGMTLDLKRFPNAAELRSLQTPAELDEYTWLVAGCVGEFWTAICAGEMPGVFTRSTSEMTALGRNFGKGLQLINILRDQAGDAAIGRCYLPEESLQSAGAGPLAWPAVDWRSWHVVRRDLIAQARTFLADGWVYAASQRSIRLRFAALMPLMIGAGTLTRMEALPVEGAPAAVKITRPEVKRLARRALWMALTGRIKPD